MQFDVINGFEVFLFATIPFMIKTEIINDFVKTANPTKSTSFRNKITELIIDYSKTFLKVGEKNLHSLKKVPNETEMAAIIATVRVVAKNDKYYGAFKKNMHIVHDMITNPDIQTDIKEKNVIDNGNGVMKFNEIMTYLHTSSPTTSFIAKYSPDRKTVTFEEHE